MKTRIIAAAVLIPLLLVVLFALPLIFTALLLSAICAVGSWELLWRTGFIKNLRLIAYSVLMAALVPVWCYFGCPYAWGLVGGLAFCFLLFLEMLISKAKLPLDKVMLCIAAGLLVPYLLCAILRIRMMALGIYYILLPFAMAFMPDTGAYFIGIFFGKHKLAPTISPKKTIEGFFGGIASGVLGVMIYGLVLSVICQLQVNFLYGILYGILGSLVSVLGDLTFSVIKRQTGIKDYGNLIPGHGGVLDRFDSVSVVAPLTEALLILLPFAEIFHG